MATTQRRAQAVKNEVSVREAAYLTSLSERIIQKAIERHEVRARVRPSRGGTARFLSLVDVCYLAVRHEAGSYLTGTARKALHDVITSQFVDASITEWPRTVPAQLTVGPICVGYRPAYRKLLTRWAQLRTIQAHVVSDPEIRGGEPIVRGTRIPVSRLVDLVAQGVSRDVVLDEHPSLTPDALDGALAYAAVGAGPPRRPRPARAAHATRPG